MSVLSAIQGASAAIGADIPARVFGATDRHEVEMQHLANEMAERIAQEHDWRALARQFTLHGEGERFDLPDDFGRFRVDAEVYLAFSGRALTRLSSPEISVAAAAHPLTPAIARWRVVGRQIVVDPALTHDSLIGGYQSAFFAIGADGEPKRRFDADDDEFALDERVLKLGIIWQWKANKGLPYGVDFDSYQRALGQAYGREGDRAVVVAGRKVGLKGSIAPFYGTIRPDPQWT